MKIRKNRNKFKKITYGKRDLKINKKRVFIRKMIR